MDHQLKYKKKIQKMHILKLFSHDVNVAGASVVQVWLHISKNFLKGVNLLPYDLPGNSDYIGTEKVTSPAIPLPE